MTYIFPTLLLDLDAVVIEFINLFFVFGCELAPASMFDMMGDFQLSYVVYIFGPSFWINKLIIVDW